ncbi:MAG: PilZ domain-containing protein [Pseudorhodoplanes sp.]
MPRPNIDPDDIIIVDRSRSARTSACILGRYALASRRNARGERREFACRTVEISCHHLTVMAPIDGPVGERVIAHFHDLGKLEGQIMRPAEDGFVMSLVQTAAQRERLAAKILWLEMRKHLNLPDGRVHRRIIPKNPHSSVMLADGGIHDCFVIDVSASGAAVSADITPEIGNVLAIGTVIGRVVRLFPEGFAIRFIALQDPDALEHLLRRP